MTEAAKLSESAEPNMLAEVMQLRAQNQKLSERLEVIEAEKRDVEGREAVASLLREGKGSPSEETAAARSKRLSMVCACRTLAARVDAHAPKKGSRQRSPEVGPR